MSPEARFEALYREHYAAVMRFARRRTDPQTAEDVTAETFAIAWRRLDRIPAHKPLPWLYVTAGHELANRRRKAASDRHKAATQEPDVGRDPADALAERDAVLKAFAALSEREPDPLEDAERAAVFGGGEGGPRHSVSVSEENFAGERRRTMSDAAMTGDASDEGDEEAQRRDLARLRPEAYRSRRRRGVVLGTLERRPDSFRPASDTPADRLIVGILLQGEREV